MQNKTKPLPSQKMQLSARDRFVVLLFSVGFFLLVLAIGLRTGPMVELVLGLIATFATGTINLLLACTWWDVPHRQEKGHRQNDQGKCE